MKHIPSIVLVIFALGVVFFTYNQTVVDKNYIQYQSQTEEEDESVAEEYSLESVEENYHDVELTDETVHGSTTE